jgi:rhodanese-related sulfurtransferase
MFASRAVVAVFAVLLAQGVSPAAAQQDDLAKVPRITLAQFKPLHAKNAVLTIDVRDPHGFDAGHVPGALNVSVVDIEIMGNRILKEKRPVVAYCACPDEHSALVVASRLMRIGVKDIKVLNGGWNGWKAAGGKVEVTPERR